MELYVHYPFCRERCPYCDFFSLTKHSNKIDIKDLIKSEIVMRKKDAGIQTIFFGGGTPSLASPDFFYDIINTAGDNLSEITVEMNPEDIRDYPLNELKTAGVTRISLGIQTLFENGLEVLSRRYNTKEALDALQKTANVFDRVSCDRIIGFKGDRVKYLKQDLQRLVDNGANHLSIYMLSLNDAQRDLIGSVDDERMAELYLAACDFLEEKGWDHYEISNWTSEQPCRHNLSVWRQNDYIGAGPGAVGTVSGVRYLNTSSLIEYNDLLRSGKLPIRQQESLDENTTLLEGAMLGLRTWEGMEIKKFRSIINPEALETLENEGYVQLNGNNIVPTKEGFLFNNYIISELLNF